MFKQPVWKKLEIFPPTYEIFCFENLVGTTPPLIKTVFVKVWRLRLSVQVEEVDKDSEVIEIDAVLK